MLRDALIERMREARIKVNTNVAEGERILSHGYGRDLIGHFSESKEEFDLIRDIAIKKKGIVLPYLADKEVYITSVAKHDFTGSGKEAINKAKSLLSTKNR